MDDPPLFSGQKWLELLNDSCKGSSNITAASKWLSLIPDHHQDIALIWNQFMTGAPIDNQLSGLYIVNDLAHRVKKNNCHHATHLLLSCFESHLFSAFQAVQHQDMSQEKKQQFIKLVKIWKKEEFFDLKILSSLLSIFAPNHPFHSTEFEQSTLLKQNRDMSPSSTPAKSKQDTPSASEIASKISSLTSNTRGQIPPSPLSSMDTLIKSSSMRSEEGVASVYLDVATLPLELQRLIRIYLKIQDCERTYQVYKDRTSMNESDYQVSENELKEGTDLLRPSNALSTHISCANLCQEALNSCNKEYAKCLDELQFMVRQTDRKKLALTENASKLSRLLDLSHRSKDRIYRAYHQSSHSKRDTTKKISSENGNDDALETRRMQTSPTISRDPQQSHQIRYQKEDHYHQYHEKTQDSDPTDHHNPNDMQIDHETRTKHFAPSGSTNDPIVESQNVTTNQKNSNTHHQDHYNHRDKGMDMEQSRKRSFDKSSNDDPRNHRDERLSKMDFEYERHQDRGMKRRREEAWKSSRDEGRSSSGGKGGTAGNIHHSSSSSSSNTSSKHHDNHYRDHFYDEEVPPAHRDRRP